jgi:hypothetical protein
MHPEPVTALRETCAELRAAQSRWEAAAALVVPPAESSVGICDRYAGARSRWPTQTRPTNEQLASITVMGCSALLVLLTPAWERDRPAAMGSGGHPWLLRDVRGARRGQPTVSLRLRLMPFTWSSSPVRTTTRKTPVERTRTRAR